MKDLQKVKEALEYYATDSDALAGVDEEESCEYINGKGYQDFGTLAKEAITLLNNHIKRLESQELVGEVAKAIHNDVEFGTFWDIEDAKTLAQAAIDIIKGNE